MEIAKRFLTKDCKVEPDPIRGLGIVTSGNFGLCGFLRCAILTLCLGQPLVVNCLVAAVLFKSEVTPIGLKVPHHESPASPNRNSSLMCPISACIDYGRKITFSYL